MTVTAVQCQSTKLNCKMVYSVITELNCNLKMSKEEEYLQSRDRGGLNRRETHGQGWELCLAQGRHSDIAAMLGQITLTLAFCRNTRGMIVERGAAAVTFLSSSPAEPRWHCRSRSHRGACHLPSVSPRAVSIATAAAQGRGSHSQSGDNIASATCQDGRGRS